MTQAERKRAEPAPSSLNLGHDDAPSGELPSAAPHGPRRQILHWAVLLLLLEKPRHGYALTNAIAELGLGDMDRPRIYRALADLEAHGLVKVWEETSQTGHVRRVYSVTDLGHESLRLAAELVVHERDALNGFLKRYDRVCRGPTRGALA